MKDNATPQVLESASPTSQGQTRSPRRILVVDDDAFIRQHNAAMLIRSGFHVDAAEDGMAAWDNLQRNSYDLMITDNNMPNMSGVELLKKLRGARMTLPAIMATGELPQEFNRDPSLQPVATLLKPYTIEKLLETVKEVLGATDHCRE